MSLGAFSIRLAVKNIELSKDYYESLGFEIFGGDITKNWLIMKSGDTIVGLFQGMFEKNIMTFNPGWDQGANTLEKYKDIRKIQADLKGKGIQYASEADEGSEGPASFSIADPDGNPILFDQHV